MALIHAATLHPSKLDAIAGWLPSQAWAPAGEVELVGAFRFDDPEGEVGLETHLVRCGGEVLQVPLTFRGAALDDAEGALVCTMEHSALGPRWVYDAPADPAYVRMLAVVTLTGVGQAAELIQADDGQRTRPPTVRLSTTGPILEPTRVDGWTATEQDGDETVMRNAELELRLSRRPQTGAGPRSGSALYGTWAGQDKPSLLATVSSLTS